MKEVTRERIERIFIPLGLAVALVAVSLWGAGQSALAKTYKNSTEAMYSRAFTELVDVFHQLDTKLAKLLVVNSPNRSMLLLDDIWRLSGTGLGLMSQIPRSHVDTEELNRFVVQLGDYAHSLTKKALEGKSMTAEDRKQLKSLYERCGEIAEELYLRFENGDIPLAVIDNEGYYTSMMDENVPSEEEIETEEGEYKDKEDIDEMPGLIYDGPFSDSAEKRQALGLRGETVEEEQARRIAEAASGIPMTLSSVSEGKIPAFDFYGETEDGRGVDVSVTKQGGQILFMMGSAAGGAEGLPEAGEAERFRDRALRYLQEQGYGDMVATYAQYYSGAALINCAAKQGDVILYNDLVKVWVDRETLEIIGLDARNYLFSHRERELETPGISLQEAEALLSPNLKVHSRALALIPLSPEEEELCYEFKCTWGENEYILYLDAEDGEEEEIFLILNGDEGQMVI